MLLNKIDQVKTTISALCRQPGKIAILTHSFPDGDGLPACVALKHILRSQGFKSDIVLEAKAPAALEFLNISEQVLIYDEEMEFATVFIVDCHEAHRTGKTAVLAEKARSVMAIDHHQQQNLQKNWYYCIKTEVVSAGAIILMAYQHDLMRLAPKERKYIGDCFYTTILNDTGGFVNSNTDADVFRLCAQIAKLGTDPAEVMEDFVLSNPPIQLRFTGQVLSSIELSSEGQVLFMHSSLALIEQNGLDSEATSNITRWVKGAQGVKVTIYAREQENGIYRLSLRSTNVNCNKICSSFDGGGHINAAGCSITGSLDEVRRTILAQVESALNE